MEFLYLLTKAEILYSTKLVYVSVRHWRRVMFH